MRLLTFYPKFVLNWIKIFWIWVKKQNSLIKVIFGPTQNHLDGTKIF